MSAEIIGIVAASAVLIAIAVWAFVKLVHPRPAEQIVINLAGREEIDVEEVLAHRFASGEIDIAAAVQLWNALAECYAVRPGLLRLTDRFNVELDSKRIFQYDDENSCANLTLERFYSKRRLAVDLSKLQTIEDCVAALCTGR